MSPTAEDLRNYDQFIASMVKDLGCFTPLPPGVLLWHYTNAQGLMGMVQSGNVYSTQVSCLNDSEEIKYAVGLFRTALKRLKEEDRDTETQQLLDGALSYFATDNNYSDTLPYFVTCFTELEDTIPHWQGYNQGESGYAIGFDPPGLAQMGDLLVRVNYDQTQHEELAMRVARATLHFYRDGLAAGRAEKPEEWAAAFMPAWDAKITQLAPLIKSPYWSHEKEHRIVKVLFVGHLPELRIVQRGSTITRHLPLKMRSDSCYPILPIKRVVLGPCPHPSISRVSVDTLLRQYGYPSGLVTVSKRPLRKM